MVERRSRLYPVAVTILIPALLSLPSLAIEAVGVSLAPCGCHITAQQATLWSWQGKLLVLVVPTELQRVLSDT